MPEDGRSIRVDKQREPRSGECCLRIRREAPLTSCMSSHVSKGMAPMDCQHGEGTWQRRARTRSKCEFCTDTNNWPFPGDTRCIFLFLLVRHQGGMCEIHQKASMKGRNGLWCTYMHVKDG